MAGCAHAFSPVLPGQRATRTHPITAHATGTSRPLPASCSVCRRRFVPARHTRTTHIVHAATTEAVQATTTIATTITAASSTPDAAAATGTAASSATAAAAAAIPAVAVAAAAATAASSTATGSTGSTDTGFLAPLTNTLETVLKYIQAGLDAVHVPYSYGWSIVLLVLFVKVLTYPITKQQVESTMATQSLKPRIDRIKKIYGDDKEKVQRETSIMYEEAGVNPLAGCLPTLLTIPIFIGLYRSLTNVASEGLLDTQGFYWIPTLAGPTTVAARQAGAGTAWLLPFVDGHPPIGWEEASHYLVLPVLLVVAQYISSAIISPPMDPNDPNYKTQMVLSKGLPLMIGWFSLNVPSGLSLYYFSNTVLTSLQQIYLRKLGGATVDVKDLGPVTKLGAGRRMGAPVTEAPWVPSYVAAAAAEAEALAAESSEGTNGTAEALPSTSAVVTESEQPASPSTTPAPESPAVLAYERPTTINRRCRRRKAPAPNTLEAELPGGLDPALGQA